jgi:hypothetical protein
MALDADATGVKAAFEINAMGTEHMHLATPQNTGSADTMASPALDAVIDSVHPPTSRSPMDEKKLNSNATGVKAALEINAMGTEHMHLAIPQYTGSADTTASPALDAVIDSVHPPTSRYTLDEKNLKQRVYPCPGCGEGADGSHQCGDCFAHVHVICGKPYEGSHEGFGQLVHCGKCNDPYDEGRCTQVWHEEEDPNGQQSSNASGTKKIVQHTQEKEELERVALAQFIAGLSKVASPDTSQKPKRKIVVGDAEKPKRMREIIKRLEELRSTRDVPEHNVGKRRNMLPILALQVV